MLNTLRRLWLDEEAPTAVEYAIMVVLIAVAIIGGAQLLGQNTNATFNNVAGQIPGQAAGGAGG
jgi:pilus assembly protein Flp/PilA